MFRHILRSSVRYLSRNRLFALLNVVGLAISLTACSLIALYVRGELSYDSHWQDDDRLYRANFITKRPGRQPQYYPISSDLMLPAMQSYFASEIELGARIFRAGPQAIHIGDTRYADGILFVDAELIEIFQFDTLFGDLSSTFLDINSIALSEESAIRYFGTSDAVGRTLQGELGGGEFDEYEVVAVYRLKSGNTVLDIQNFALYDQEKVAGQANFFQSWLRISVQTFIKLSESSSSENANARMPDLLDQFASLPASRLEAGQTPSDVLGIELQKVGDIYLNPIPFINIDQESGDQITVYVFIVISFLVLLVGCINFVVLATALAAKRSKEVAMRKVLGARSEQLVIQYLSESLLLALVSFAIALATVGFTLPLFESFLGKDLSLSLGSFSTWLYLLLLFTAVALFGGLYPAFFLANQRPITALRSRSTTSIGGFFSLRNVLIVFQFAISVALIMATLSIYGQLYYAESLDPGLNTKNLITMPGLGNPEVTASKNTITQELLRLPGVTSVGFSAVPPGSGLGLILDYSASGGANGSRDVALSTLMIGYGFFETYQMPLVVGRYPEEGRDIGQELLFMLEVSEQDTEGVNDGIARILTNVTATERLGFSQPEDAVGSIIETIDATATSYQEFEIIGVVEDSQFRSLRTAPDAEIFYLNEDRANLLTLRFEGNGQDVLAEVTTTWNSIVGDVELNPSFVEEELANTYNQERNEGLLLISFSILSLFIAGLGLFGIATFNVERRARETGLRKILGAETQQIVAMLIWQITKPVMVANLVALPIGIWAIVNWLSRFPYQFERWLLIPICLLAGLLAVLIACSIVFVKTTNVARASPMRALRHE